MLHAKAEGRSFMPNSIAASWGPRTWYIEVEESQFATRFIEVFMTGDILRYDQNHWCDDYGQLLGLRFSLHPKWKKHFRAVEIITADAFEAQWQAAKQSRLWNLQIATSRMDRWGQYPSWLTNTASDVRST
jgi:hypothetical protein